MDDLGLVFVELAQAGRPAACRGPRSARPHSRNAPRPTSSSISRNSRGRSSGAVPRGFAAKSRTLILSILTPASVRNDAMIRGRVEISRRHPPAKTDRPSRMPCNAPNRAIEGQGREALSRIEVPDRHGLVLGPARRCRRPSGLTRHGSPSLDARRAGGFRCRSRGPSTSSRFAILETPRRCVGHRGLTPTTIATQPDAPIEPIGCAGPSVFRFEVPDRHGVVLGPRDDASPVRAHRHGTHPTLMPGEPVESRARFEVPHRHGPVTGPRDDASPVGAHRHGTHRNLDAR